MKTIWGNLLLLISAQLCKGQFDFEDRDIHHRHISHLYPFLPDNQITPAKDMELTKAVKRVLERRGDQATGWSMGWKVNMWARMYDGDKSLEILSKLIKLAIENNDRFKSKALEKAGFRDSFRVVSRKVCKLQKLF